MFFLFIKGLCDSTEYWQPINLNCLSYKNFNESCSLINLCYSPLNCTNGICLCSNLNNYYDTTTKNCLLQKSINITCLGASSCRSDQGLACLNGMCQCSQINYKWSIERSMCILPKTYTEQTCTYDSDCNVENGLI